jgi:hypothetical protein
MNEKYAHHWFFLGFLMPTDQVLLGKIEVWRGSEREKERERERERERGRERE